MQDRIEQLARRLEVCRLDLSSIAMEPISSDVEQLVALADLLRSARGLEFSELDVVKKRVRRRLFDENILQ